MIFDLTKPSVTTSTDLTTNCLPANPDWWNNWFTYPYVYTYTYPPTSSIVPTRYTSKYVDGVLTYEFEVPGVKKSDIIIKFDNGALDVSFTNRKGVKDSFHVETKLPSVAESSAKLEDGILTVTLKEDAKQHHTITVE